MLQLRREIEELTAKLNTQQGAAQDSKEHVKQEVVKEEENSNSEPTNQVKEEQISVVCSKKEEEEEIEVSALFMLCGVLDY